MQVRILRGAHEIGGSCVEVAADSGSRIVLDVGKPLWAGWDETVPLAPGPRPGRWVRPLARRGGDLPLAPRPLRADRPGRPRGPTLHWQRRPLALLKAAEFFSSAGVDLHPTGYLSDRSPRRDRGLHRHSLPHGPQRLRRRTHCSWKQTGVGSSTPATSEDMGARDRCSRSWSTIPPGPSTCFCARVHMSVGSTTTTMNHREVRRTLSCHSPSG